MAATTPPIGVIGAGRVGGALAALWHAAGLNVAALFSRDMENARAAAQLCTRTARRRKKKAPQAYDDWDPVARAGSWLILAVPDDDIATVSAALATDTDVTWEGRTVLHTSGYHPASVLTTLKDKGATIGALHPLQSVPSAEQGVERIPGCTFAIDGEPKALTVARKLVKAAGGAALKLPPEARALYHASAVLASNALVALLDVALETMTAAGVPEKKARAALIPLVQGTVENVEELSTGRALTGPVARGDLGTVEGHLAALTKMPRPGFRAEPSAAEVYKVLSRRALGITSRRQSLTNAHLKLAKLLKRD